eukprot:TRINITY_DN24511_c0_g5_i2.p1 TRINITY_DN24511_c0_g5~~TRINITY_DN24511_c0_g5_i2.p1  ORF type:complete len:453 (+),score=122.04 TRINITY_DN24511_c0_g5_i2:103-1461(+)
MGARCGAYCGRNPHEPGSFRDGDGTVRLLIVCCDYRYIPAYKLTSVRDGENIERIARNAGVKDITFMRDDLPASHDLFPTAKNLVKQIELVGARSAPEDFFVFFYAGHADTIAPHLLKRAQNVELAAEEDGKDECFQLPGPNLEFDWKWFLVDDEFARVVDGSFPESVMALVITDCCHSGTIADVDTHDWGRRPVCSFAACRDYQESTDTGRGGVLSKAIEYAVRELAFRKGKKEYSIQKVWDVVERYALWLERDQDPRMMWRNLDPKEAVWPMPQAWWENMPGTTAFKLQQEIERLRQEHAGVEAGVRAVALWQDAANAENANAADGRERTAEHSLAFEARGLPSPLLVPTAAAGTLLPGAPLASVQQQAQTLLLQPSAPQLAPALRPQVTLRPPALTAARAGAVYAGPAAAAAGSAPVALRRYNVSMAAPAPLLAAAPAQPLRLAQVRVG